MKRYPAKLPRGGTIGVVCPGSSIQTAQLGQCAKAITDMGYRVKLEDNLDTNVYGIMAGDGRLRAQWVNRMFADPEVDAIVCARGGDGSSIIMEYLDYDLICSNPKIFCGYSDVTNLQLAFTQRCDLVTFYGPMVTSNMINGFDAQTKASFFAAINAEKDFEFVNPREKEMRTMQSGSVCAELTGGNLSLLASSIGTPYELDCREKILGNL